MLYRSRTLSVGRPVLLVRLSGPFDLERSVQTLASFEFAAREGDWKGLVWDARRRTDYPDAAALRELVLYWNRWDRVAIVALNDVQYGMGRMANILSEHVVPFRSVREAIEWAGGAPPK